jgi:RND family efflux transporter MFP subunit
MQVQSPEESGRQIVYVDRALWRRLAQARTVEEFAHAWLPLQCSIVGGVRAAVVVYGEPEIGPFRPVATFPDGSPPGGRLGGLCEDALEAGESRILEPGPPGDDLAIAYPLRVDSRTYGVVGLQLRQGADAADALRQLQWGSAWLDAWVRREHAEEEQQTAERLLAVLDLVASVLAHERFRAAAAALATELATRLGCDRVSVGVVRKGRCEVVALSHSALGDDRMNLLRAIGAAMEEAVDQREVLLYPEPDDAPLLVLREHRRLLEQYGNGAVLTIPLHGDTRAFGALLLERPSGARFAPADVELCKTVALALGPMLDLKRGRDRSIWRKAMDWMAAETATLLGPRHPERKLVGAALAVVAAVLAFSTGEYRVTANAAVEGSVRRSVTAPIDGYVVSAEVRPGDTVAEGALLARFDDRDLRLQRLQVESERAQLLARQQEATAGGDRAAALVTGAQVQQSDAHLALLDEQLERTEVRAPFEGLVVSGDLSQSLGAPLQRGTVMFEIAPLDAYRVVLEVDERDVAQLAAGQPGTLVLAALPSTRLGFAVRRVTPVATAVEGSNVFRVEADLDASDRRVRPGMEGVAKVAIERRRLIWIWTHDLVRWAQLKLWSWWP